MESYVGSRGRINLAKTVLGSIVQEINGKEVYNDKVIAIAQVHATLAIAEAIRELADVLAEKPI